MTDPLPEPLALAVRRQEEGFTGVLALWVHDLRTDETYGLRADETFHPASVIKLFVLREFFRQVEAGTVSPTDEVVMRAADVVPGTGVLKDLEPGLRLRLGDAATLMITVSDNVATNLVIDRLGAAAINRSTREAGYRDTQLAGKLYNASDLRSRVTARDAGRLMADVAGLRAVSPGASSAMLRVLRRSQPREIVGRFLPPEVAPGADGGVRIASKSGTLDGMRHEVAYVEGPGVRYVAALMSRNCADQRVWPDNEATLCLARLARSVHDHVSRSD